MASPSISKSLRPPSQAYLGQRSYSLRQRSSSRFCLRGLHSSKGETPSEDPSHPLKKSFFDLGSPRFRHQGFTFQYEIRDWGSFTHQFKLPPFPAQNEIRLITLKIGKLNTGFIRIQYLQELLFNSHTVRLRLSRFHASGCNQNGIIAEGKIFQAIVDTLNPILENMGISSAQDVEINSSEKWICIQLEKTGDKDRVFIQLTTLFFTYPREYFTHLIEHLAEVLKPSEGEAGLPTSALP